MPTEAHICRSRGDCRLDVMYLRYATLTRVTKTETCSEVMGYRKPVAHVMNHFITTKLKTGVESYQNMP